MRCGCGALPRPPGWVGGGLRHHSRSRLSGPWNASDTRWGGRATWGGLRAGSRMPGPGLWWGGEQGSRQAAEMWGLEPRPDPTAPRAERGSAMWVQHRLGGRRCSWAPPTGDLRASPGGSLGSACPYPLPRETLKSGPSGDPGCPPCLPAVDAAAPGLRWARLTAKRHWFQTCPQHTRKTSWFPGRRMDGTVGPAACAASPWPAAGAQTG